MHRPDPIAISSCNASRAVRLAAYAMAAGSATAASAEVVYSGPQNLSIALGFSQSIDLNLDGSNDIELKNFIFGGGNYQGATVNYFPGRLVGFNAGPNNFAYVAALAEGTEIGPGNIGPTFFGSLAYGGANPNAQFNDVTDAFIGLSFPALGPTYFAWIRVDVNNARGTFLVKDWGYENTDLKPIAAGAGIPEPSTLALLAAGAAGVALWRRR